MNGARSKQWLAKTWRDREFLTTGQVAEILHVTPATVSKFFDTKKIDGYREGGISGNDRRVDVASLITFMKNHNIPDNVAEMTLLGPGDVGKILHIASRTVSKLFDSGGLKGYRLPLGLSDEDGNRYVDAASLLTFMNEQNPPIPTNVAGMAILGVNEAAKILHISPRTASQWFDSGQLTGYRIPRNGEDSQDSHRYIDAASVVKYLSDNGADTAIVPQALETISPICRPQSVPRWEAFLADNIRIMVSNAVFQPEILHIGENAPDAAEWQKILGNAVFTKGHAEDLPTLSHAQKAQGVLAKIIIIDAREMGVHTALVMADKSKAESKDRPVFVIDDNPDNRRKYVGDKVDKFYSEADLFMLPIDAELALNKRRQK